MNLDRRFMNNLIEADLPSLVAIYKQLHAEPELSGQELKTSALLARELKTLGFTVTEGIGRYERYDWPGYGVVAVLENGAGPTVLLRADMDALPVEEKTWLPYQSRAKAIYRDGKEVCVMHACGHDVHVATLLGTARLLAATRPDWRGTLVLIGQPGEEGGGGAQAMLNDGAYLLCPEPDFALALHATLQLQAGTVSYVPGPFMASFTELEIAIFGVGSHGSTPELGKDPIVMAAQLVIALQTIVSRETSPLEQAVVTIGSIHGGTTSNIIPEEVRLQISVRTYQDGVRDRIVASIDRMARGVAMAAGVPGDRLPVVTVKSSHPVNYNDPELAERVARALRDTLGEAQVLKGQPVMVSEDFGSWGLDGRIPTCMFWLGAADPEAFTRSLESRIPLPPLHSPQFAPAPEPTLRAGVAAMSAAALELLGKKTG